MRAHRQADVTDHQLYNYVYSGHHNSDHSRMTLKKWNEWINCIKHYGESEEGGMQDHGAFVYDDVGVVLLQL